MKRAILLITYFVFLLNADPFEWKSQETTITKDTLRFNGLQIPIELGHNTLAGSDVAVRFYNKGKHTEILHKTCDGQPKLRILDDTLQVILPYEPMGSTSTMYDTTLFIWEDSDFVKQ